MDNRKKDKPDVLDEIEQDETPVDEGENPKDNNPDDKDIDKNSDSDDDSGADDEDILLEDEEIDEETGEVKKKEAKPAEKKAVLPEEEERYRAQRREATIVNEKNKQLSDAFKKANEIKEPTEDELKSSASKDGFEWDDLSTFEKSQYKKNFVNDQKLSILNEVGSKVSNIDAWAGTVDTFLDENASKQTNKALIGKEAAFREFAMKESHRGADMELLTSAFLHTVPETKKHKGSIMLTRTGGERQEKVNKLQDADYVSALRRNNPREYTRLLRAGKINLDV